jgi:hypothetical protein
MRHRSTWGGRIKKDGVTQQYFNQIDYILIRQQLQTCLKDARAYNGQMFNSDHSLVVATLDMRQVHRKIAQGNAMRTGNTTGSTKEQGNMWQRKMGVGREVDINQLGIVAEVRQCYTAAVEEPVRTNSILEDQRPKQKYEKLNAVLEEAAKTAIPGKLKRNSGRVEYHNDAELQKLSQTQKLLREKIRRRTGGTWLSTVQL